MTKKTKLNKTIDDIKICIQNEIRNSKSELDSLSAKLVQEGIVEISTNTETPYIFLHGQSTLLEDKIIAKDLDRMRNIFDDIDQKLPSITKAFKTQRKAKKINLTYANYEEALQDLLSEVEELQNAKNNEDRKSEIGDILFSIVNVCRHLDADPEIQLNQSTSRFIQRAKYVENNFDEDADIEQLWKDAKKSQFK